MIAGRTDRSDFCCRFLVTGLSASRRYVARTVGWCQNSGPGGASSYAHLLE